MRDCRVLITNFLEMIFITVFGCPARCYAIGPTSAISTYEKMCVDDGFVFSNESFFAGRSVDTRDSLGTD
jgi:hypothetical protein